MIPTRPRHFLLLLCLLLLVSCKSAAELLYPPKATDPLDGYNSLSQAGINTEMDWGPKEERLLSQYKTLKGVEAELRTELEKTKAERDNLKRQLNNDGLSLEQEKRRRAEIEAQFELKNQKLREQETTILTLRIEKAKLEQANLLAKIDALKQSMPDSSANPVEASATPPGRH
ncbi:MAG: hypothetical protein IT456_23405 [Planctomycetes bacterium]|jgi:septal ring factor EnvC (AmiA/AmiB activator)|nr:hypothetical protein [Planctomycetota bacterium]